MVFAIVFGLSMDYEVFLMSRMHEEWERSHDADELGDRPFADWSRNHGGRGDHGGGLRLVLLGDDRVIKLFGVGLASAVLIDAVIIRTILVPAIMVLLGKRAWWFPAWLGRVVPRLSVEPAGGEEGCSPEEGVILGTGIGGPSVASRPRIF